MVEQVLSAFSDPHHLLRSLSHRNPASRRAWLHPYRSARVVAEGLTVGWFGQLHPTEAAARKLKDIVLIGELYLDRLYKLPLRKPAARDISRFQPVRRDFSLVLDQSTSRGKRSIRPSPLFKSPSWSTGAPAEVFRDARHRRAANTRCSSAPPSRRPTAPFAKRNCNHSNRAWSKPSAKPAHGCVPSRVG